MDTKTGVHIIIDYFSATFPFICYEEDSEYKIINEILLMITDFFNIPFETIEKLEYSQNRFNYQYKLGNDIILRLLGPELKSGHKSCSIEMKGEGCREFENTALDKTWFDFLTFFLIRLNSAPTRIDLTIDDYEGKDITLPVIRKKLEQGQFITSFRDKDFIMHGPDKKGLSIQFGSRTSSHM